MDRHLNHKLLRENRSLEDMNPAERRIYEYELKIKKDRLKRGYREIEELKKVLDGVVVYKGVEQQKTLHPKKDLNMIKFQPQKVAEIQLEVNKRDHTNNGTTLKELLASKSARKNPFKQVVEMDEIIADSLQEEKVRKRQEKKALLQQLEKSSNHRHSDKPKASRASSLRQ